MRQQQSEEINESSEVLQSAGQPPAETKQVRGYDFVHPDKLSKLNLRALEIIFTSLEKSWAAVLSTALRSETLVQLNSMEQAAFSAHAE
jgi:flagellar motor switch protein FliM